MKRIDIQFVPAEQMRYSTCGDYQEFHDHYKISIVKMDDWRYEFLILFHELLELAWVLWKGVNIDDIDAFDMQYEKDRQPGDDSEPGDDRNAPYHEGHVWATVCERIAAKVLHVRWSQYEDAVLALF